jgi:hypothetical protein
VIVGICLGLALALAYRSSKGSGKTFPQFLQGMPAYARRYAEDLRGRAEEAVASGRQAAVEKEMEIDTVLTGDMRTPAVDGTHSNS